MGTKRVINCKILDEGARKNITNSKEQRRIFKNIILISVAFFLNFTGFQGLSKLQSSLHHVEGMGVINQGVLYSVLIVASLFLPKILMAKLGHKWTIAISIIGYILWMAANGYAVWATMVPASVIVGLAAGPFWSAQGSYFTLIAPSYAKLTKNTDEATLTRFIGIFFGLFQASNIVGAILSSTILLVVPSNTTVSNFTDSVVGVCGAQVCSFKDLSNASIPNLEKPSENVVWILLATYIGIALIAVCLVAVFVDRLPEKLRTDRASGCKESTNHFLATLKHYSHKETLLLFPITIYAGLGNAFFNAEFFQSYVSCSAGIGMVGYVSLPYSIVNAFTSVCTARLTKHVGQLPFFLSATVVDISIQLTLLFWIPKPDQFWILFLLSAIWGYSDGIWQTHVYALYGTVFPDETEAAFSCRMVADSLGYVMAFSYSYFLCTSVKIYILISMLFCGMTGYLALERVRRQGSKIYVINDTRL